MLHNIEYVIAAYGITGSIIALYLYWIYRQEKKLRSFSPKQDHE